ncbi:hypothetical protein, partial [Cloacibacillus evryensis]|uniref:hypothetical protein n=1 Tax=Cloacibacillus evryensis TaxID=508460 RepID=UPI0022E25594
EGGFKGAKSQFIFPSRSRNPAFLRCRPIDAFVPDNAAPPVDKMKRRDILINMLPAAAGGRLGL